jgi:pyrimidine deaminase RibD-like protein
MLEVNSGALVRKALELARRGIFLTPPNPRVGCVIAHAKGTVCGAGHTQPAGLAHAEVMALRDAAAKGLSVKVATALLAFWSHAPLLQCPDRSGYCQSSSSHFGP